MAETLKELRSLSMEELIRRHDAQAVHVQVATKHYLDEIARRDTLEQLQAMVAQTQTMVEQAAIMVDQTRMVTSINQTMADHTSAIVEQGKETTILNEKMVRQTSRMLQLTVIITVLTIANVVLVAYSLRQSTAAIPAPVVPTPAVSPSPLPPASNHRNRNDRLPGDSGKHDRQ